jgi:chemotaxis protein methyltransferase CheR
MKGQGAAAAIMLNHEERELELLKDHLRQVGGLDYRCYKTNYLKRRLAVRMRATNITTYHDYLDLLRREPTEYDKLLDRLTINVSHFFRDLEAFKSLGRIVMPTLESKKKLKIWSAGCANGEEPYTLAMLFLDKLQAGRQVQIIATDIDTTCLAYAQAGMYKETSLQEVPYLLRQKYFEHRDGGWTVLPEPKACVTFTRHDLTGRMPAGPFDLIVCRNVMIYFNRQLQERLLREFHRLLSPDGFLMLGKTEVLLSECRVLYKSLDVNERIYQRQVVEDPPDMVAQAPGDGRPGL